MPLKSASNAENAFVGLFDNQMQSISSQKEFCVEESNDLSYTILQVASASNQKQKGQNVINNKDQNGHAVINKSGAASAFLSSTPN